MPGTTITFTPPNRTWSITSASSIFGGLKSAGFDVVVTDPVIEYIKELETVVGKRGWDWDIRWNPRHRFTEIFQVIIKFRKGKEKYAAYFALKWS